MLGFAIGGSLLLVLGIFLALTLSLNLNKLYVPTPQDESLRLEAAATTKTANYNGASLDLGIGFAPGGIGAPMAAVISPSAIDRAQSDETYQFVLQESSDNATFTDCGPAINVDVAGAAATIVTYTAPGFVSQRYVRCKLTVGGTTPSITYEAWLNPNVSLKG